MTYILPRLVGRTALLCGLVIVIVPPSTAAAYELGDGGLQPTARLGWSQEPALHAGGHSALSLALAWAGKQHRRHELAGSVVLTVPTGGWLAAPRLAKRSRAIPGPSPAASAPKRPGGPAQAVPAADRAGEEHAELLPCQEEPEDAAALGPSERSATGPSEQGGDGPGVDSRDARNAMRAARRAAVLGRHRHRLNQLASRARWSAALPRVRLRVTRLIDESASVSPTSYDAERQTATGGTSLWLEARTTWQLDRALFASEEIALERLRYAYAREEARVERDALSLLLAWQEAAAALVERPPGTSGAECRRLRLRERQLAVELDLTTGGWFDRWSRRAAGRVPRVDCGPPP